MYKAYCSDKNWTNGTVADSLNSPAKVSATCYVIVNLVSAEANDIDNTTIFYIKDSTGKQDTNDILSQLQ